MRIAIVSDWFAPRRGGIEGQLFELAERLGARGHAVDVITSTPDAVGGSAFRVRQLDVLRLPGAGIAISPRLPGALRQALRDAYDVVHAHVSVASPVGYTGAAVSRSLKLPTVVTFHSVLRHKRHLLRLGNAIANLSQSAVQWTAVSDLVARQVADALLRAEIAVLPNGIDLAFWQSGSGQLQSPRSALTLVSAMRLRRKKRPVELVRAFARGARRANVAARLIIAGDGPEKQRIQHEISALGLDGGDVRAESRSWITAAELRALYAEADAFVLPSTREAFGIAALEARASGLPVIAMSASGSSEFLQHEVTALLCKDDADLTAQIERMLSDTQLRTRLAAGHAPVERYDWTQVLAAHEAAYHRATTRAAAAGLVAASA